MTDFEEQPDGTELELERIHDLKKLKRNAKSSTTKALGHLAGLLSVNEAERNLPAIREALERLDGRKDETLKIIDALEDLYRHIKDKENAKKVGDEGESIVEQIEMIASPTRRFLAESVIRDTTRSPTRSIWNPISQNSTFGVHDWNLEESNGATSTPPTTSSDVAHRQLERIKIPVFSGNKLEFESWYAAFSTCVDKTTLEPQFKMLRLESCLAGEALETVKGLGYSSAAYEAAKSRLTRKFGGERRQVQSHLEDIKRLKPIQEDNVKELEKFADVLERAVVTLKENGKDADLEAGTLYSIVLEKIPEKLLALYYRKLSEKGEKESLLTLKDWVTVEAEFQTRASEIKHGLVGKKKEGKATGQRDERHHNKWPGTGAALFSNASQRKLPPCCYCLLPDHAPTQCNIVTNIQKRKEILRRTGRCYICTRKNHISKDCTSRSRCPKCQGRHHSSICEQKTRASGRFEDKVKGEVPSNPPKQPEVTTVSLSSESTETKSSTLCSGSKNLVLLQTAKASAYRPDNPHRRVIVRLILDGGSQRSYITEGIKAKLNLQPSHSETLTIKPFGSSGGTPQQHDVVPLCIAVKGGKDVTLLAISVPLISSPVQGQFPKETAQKYPHLSGLELADDCNGDATVDMLIGADNYWNFVTGGVIRGASGPTAIHTKTGWVLSGPTGAMENQSTVATNLSTTVLTCEVSTRSTCEICDSELQKFWDLESLGIVPNENSVHDTFEQRVEFDGKKYQVSLPWKEPHPILHDHHDTCMRRLKSLLTRLGNEPEILKEYQSVIKEQLDRGIVEEVSEIDSGEIGEVHYLPHHPVVRKDKQTTKVRVVFDASCKQGGGPSLNDCLHAGPSLTENIADILIRFRSHKTALIGDIEKAFHMISINEDDRNMLRFLWVDDPCKENPEVKIYRFAAVVFGLACSPFLLNATLKHHISQFKNDDPEFVYKFLQSLYVDDLVSGESNDDRAYELYIKAKLRMAEGGFNLRKFASNSKELMCRINDNEKLNELSQGSSDTQVKQNNAKTITEEDESYAKSTTGPQENTKLSDKVLGIQWDKKGDTLVMDPSQVVSEVSAVTPTKRQVVRLTSRFYDPVGFIAPITVKLKLLCQNLCKKKLEWDATLDDQCKQIWLKLLHELRESEPIYIPRYYFEEVKGEIKTVSLHGFSDASAEAYAAVIYLRIESTESSYLRLVTAKTRVAPLTRQTIPRLELLAALILTRLITRVKEALSGVLQISYIRCWSDSKVALYWICGETRVWKQFVQNRVLEIRNLVAPEFWSYCAGKDNPADIPSRGSSPVALMESMWFAGPEWLRNYDENAAVPFASSPIAEALQEVKAKEPTRQNLEATSLLVTRSKEQVGAIIDCQSYSCISKLLGVTAHVLKFIDKLKGKVTMTPHSLTEYIAKAEELWIREIQAKLTTDTKFKSWSREFGVYQDEKGILRCGGRLDNAQLTEDQKHPILLDVKHHVTTLIVEQSHQRVMHNGVKETLTELRSRFWIVRGRQFVRKVLHGCRKCKRHQGKSYAAPDPPALPSFRTSVDRPFTYTGIDFAGPLYVKDGEGKVYMVIYTCGVSRAVHLDIVSNLTAESFLLSFRRFAARRGVPLEVKSDNGKTFKSAAKSLQALFDLPEVREHFERQRIKWTFNLEKAPWWGGFFERLIKSVKRCLKKVLGCSRLATEELYTVLLEIEATLNSRPLTYVSTEDLEEPVTPFHLMAGTRLLSLPDQQEETNVDRVDGHAQARRVSHLRSVKEHFWGRWKKEYLLELRNAHRLRSKPQTSESIKAGDIVIIHDESKRRAFWNLGRVEQLITGKDHAVRGAVVRKINSKRGSPTLLRRPLQKLYPIEQGVATAVKQSIEVQQHGAGSDAKHDVSSRGEQPTSNPRSSRPRRVAAITAERRVKTWLS